MKIAAVIEYITDAAKVDAHRPAHRQYLRSLLESGRLAATGPFTDAPGALIVYEAAGVDEAEQLLKNDPFHAAGIFVRWQLRPWHVVMANRESFPAGGPT